MEEEEERRRLSVDYDISVTLTDENELSQRKKNKEHYEEEPFPNYGDALDDEGAIHIKTGIHNSAFLNSEPDILKQ